MDSYRAQCTTSEVLKGVEGRRILADVLIMRILPYFLFVIFLNVVYSSLNDRDDYQDFQNEYPNDVDYPSILHKYEFNDPGMTFNPTGKHYEDNKEDNSIDYETFEASSRDFERGIPNGLFQSNEDASSEGDNVCNTKVCHKAANDILNNIDASIDPCDNFEKFACGGWRKLNPIPKSTADWSVFTKLWKDEEGILRDLIERQANSSLDSSGSLIYNWYSSCMNNGGINTRGAFPLLKLIAKLGSCPLISPFWFPFGWTFVDHLISLNRLAINPFFTVLPTGDPLNSSRVLLHVKPSKLVMGSIRFYVKSGEYYTVVRRAYIKMMMGVMKMLSLRSRRSFSLYYINQIRNVYILEILLAKARLSTKVATYHKMTLKQLQWEVPEFPWRTYIFKLYHNISQKKPITGDEIISISNLMVLRKIAKVIRLTPKSTLANYIIWNVAFKFSDDVSPEFYAIRHKFFAAKYGEYKRKERWQECVVSTSSALDMAVGKLFVEETFSEDSKQKAAKITEDIREQLIKDFENLTWMDTNTTKNAKEKANVMAKNIGYPKFILNETKVRAYYKGMLFDPKDFLFNKLQRRIILSKNSLSSREKKPDRASWSMAPQQINAYYSLNYNKIVILAGILQAPFWDAGHPMSIQYGGIGFIIGHEMTHGFDDQGMMIDKHGNYHSWSSNASSAAFKTKSHCLQDQYSKFKIFSENINGKLTLGENIADNAGIKLAFKAYQKWLKTNGPDKTLPNLPFNSKQLFFLKSAQIWCSNVRKKSTLSRLGVDPHPPKIFRVIGPFSNFNEFSKAYNCSSKSKMNPPKKCFVW